MNQRVLIQKQYSQQYIIQYIYTVQARKTSGFKAKIEREEVDRREARKDIVTRGKTGNGAKTAINIFF